MRKLTICAGVMVALLASSGWAQAASLTEEQKRDALELRGKISNVKSELSKLYLQRESVAKEKSKREAMLAKNEAEIKQLEQKLSDLQVKLDKAREQEALRKKDKAATSK